MFPLEAAKGIRTIDPLLRRLDFSAMTKAIDDKDPEILETEVGMTLGRQREEVHPAIFLHIGGKTRILHRKRIRADGRNV